MITIVDLPVELIDRILQYLTLKDIVTCYTASRLFHVVSVPRFNRLYRTTNLYRLIQYRSIKDVRYKVETMGVTIDDAIFRFTMFLNRPTIIDYFIDNKFLVETQHLNCGITCGHIDLVEHLLKKSNMSFDIYSPFVAVRNCSVSGLKRLRELGLQYNDDCVDTAVKRNCYTIVMYLYNLGLRATTLIDAATVGNVMVIKLLLEHGAPNINTAFNLAARRGHLVAIKLLHTKGGAGTAFAIHQAACYNYIETVRYLHFIGTPTNMFTFDSALRDCSIKACRQLMAMGLYCGRKGINEVAKRGNVKLLQYIHEKQRLYYHATELNPLDYAAIYRRKESVRYLVTLGYPIHGTALQQVVLDDDIETLTLIIA